MRTFLATFLLITACQGSTGTPIASASPAASSSPIQSQLTAPTAGPLVALPKGTVTIAGRAVAVDIAATADSRRQGLSGRTSLAQDTGLVLGWTAPTAVSIWMPDMNFAIDVIFVRNGSVLAVYPDVPPCVPGEPCPTFGPTLPVDFVLEVPAGNALALGVKIGSPASYKPN
ncbi:MAG: hypothetical protein JWM80_2758 [Cyanobacteria bacterium RYN_339]|nr:hypothetical protein [Cyanobacteria bacterium RYN_339]